MKKGVLDTLNGGQSWSLCNNPPTPGNTTLNLGAYQTSPALLALTVNNLSAINSYRNGQSIASATATIRPAPAGQIAIGRDQQVHELEV